MKGRITMKRSMWIPGLLLASAALAWPTSRQDKITKPGATQVPPGPKASISVVIDLTENERSQLDDIYDRYAAIRLASEAEIASLRDALDKEQSASAVADRRRNDMTKQIKQAEQRIARAFMEAHASAYRELLARHRVHLQTLPSDPDVFLIDRYWQLLVMKPEDLWNNPIEQKAVSSVLRREIWTHVSPNRYWYYSSPRYGFKSYGYGYFGYRPFFNPYYTERFGVGIRLGPNGHPYVYAPGYGWVLHR